MADFTGFYYGDEHSSTYHLIRVSKGKRYGESLFPEFKDDKKEMVGGDETLYFRTSFSQRKFPIEVAFDNLREEDFRKLRKWLAPKQVKALRFDERPYKAYWAKLEKTPTFEYVCFMEEDEDTLEKVRVYKGEAKLDFVAYDPIGYCNDDTTKITYNGLETAPGYNWQELKTYSPLLMKDDNLIEWAAESGLLNNMEQYNVFEEKAESPYEYIAKVFNPGDMPTNYEVCFGLEDDAPNSSELSVYLYEDEEQENLISAFNIYLTGLRKYDRIIIDTKKHTLKIYPPNREITYEEVGGKQVERVQYKDKDGEYIIEPENDLDKLVYSEINRQLRYDLVRSSHWQTIPCNIQGEHSIMKIKSAIKLNGVNIKYGYRYY